jgi:hypothetical protein
MYIHLVCLFLITQFGEGSVLTHQWLTGPPTLGDHVLCVTNTTYITVTGGLCVSQVKEAGDSRKTTYGISHNKPVLHFIEKWRDQLKNSTFPLCTISKHVHFVVARVGACMISVTNLELVSMVNGLLDSSWTLIFELKNINSSNIVQLHWGWLMLIMLINIISRI